MGQKVGRFKIISLLLFLFILIGLNPLKITASSEEVLLISENEEINLYDEPTSEIVKLTIQSHTKVILLDSELEGFSYIQYEDVDSSEEQKVIKGYVKDIHISSVEETKDLNKQENEEAIEKKEQQEDEEEKDLANSEDNSSDTSKENENAEDENEQDESLISEENEYTEDQDSDESAPEEEADLEEKEDQKLEEEKVNNKDKSFSLQSFSQKKIRGIAQKERTYIRTKPSTKSKPLQIVSQGTILNYKQYNKHWYEVSINGKKGYIHRKHVEHSVDTQEAIRGIAKNSPTNIRKKASTKSSIGKQYAIGSIIDYKTFSKYWYEVYENGKVIGYVHKKHVENSVSNQKSNFGITTKSPTNIRAGASTKTKIIGTLPIRSIKEYKTFSKYWYEVSMNGKKGYIHKKHIKNAKNQDLRGVALKKTTYIRTRPSTKSAPLTKVPIGTVLEYKVHNAHWYETLIKGEGVGYVHKKHVENAVMSQKNIKGATVKDTTYIRKIASTKADPATTYPGGKFINYKTFSKYWYEVPLGNEVGYIHKKHVHNVTASQKKSQGVALKGKTYIRTAPSTKSKALTTFTKGTLINYKTFNKHWNEAIVTVNGQEVSGFIHKKHIGNQKVIFIDAGHGGSDPGAIANGLREKDITLDLAKRVENKLKNKGYLVVMSRTSDTYPSLKDRTNHANKIKADIFVSIHVNSGGGTGIETWMQRNGPEPSKSEQLASSLQSEMVKQTGANSRGIKDGNLHVNRESKMPSALVEVGFIDHSTDARRLKQTSYLDKIANGIVNGIDKYFH